MATYSRVKTFVANETLTASDLNTEFNNIITNTNSGNLNSDNVSTSAAWTWTGYHTYSTSSRIVLADNIYMTLGNATDGDYRLRYNSSSTALELTSTNSDGSGTDAVVMDVQDGTDDVRIRGGLSTNNNAAPTSGIVTGGNIVSDTDSTDDLGTTSVRWANLYVDAATITNNLTVGGTLTLTGGLTLNGNVTVGDNASDTLTINSTITSNLIFTDATYDIGASGATRPRDLFLSRNALMGGTLGVTGLLTATAGVTSGSNIVSDTDSTDDLGTTSVRWANLYADSIGDSGQALAVKATTLSFDAAATIDTSGNNNLSLDAGTATLTLDAGTIESDAGTLSFDSAASIDTSGNNALAISTGSANLNVTAGTLALTGAQTISSTLGVTGDLAVATDGLFVDVSEERVGINQSSPSATLTAKAASNTLHAMKIENAAGQSVQETYIEGSGNPSMSFRNASGTQLIQISTHEISKFNASQDFAVNTSQLYVDYSASAVGIGTASPEAALHVNNGASITNEPANTRAIFSNGSGADAVSRVGIYAGAGSGFAVLDLGRNDASSRASITYNAAEDRLDIGTVDGAADISIDTSGNLLVGTLSGYGTNKLNVNGGIAIDGRGAATPGLCEKGDVDTGVYWPTTNTIGITNGGSESLRVDSSRQLLVGYTSSNGSYKLQVNSQIYATNATIATSDGRYKENVQTLSNATDLVLRLNPVQFTWKAHDTHDFKVGKTDVGFIAQEVQKVLSDTDYSDSVVVSNKTDDEEYLGLGETKLIPLLTAAIQELTQRVKELESN